MRRSGSLSVVGNLASLWLIAEVHGVALIALSEPDNCNGGTYSVLKGSRLG